MCADNKNLSVRRFDWLKRNLESSLARTDEEANVPEWAHRLPEFVQGFSRASLETRERLRPLSFP